MKKVKIHIPPLPDYSREDVKGLRISLGITRRTLARILGLSERTIENWEVGKNNPTGPSCRLLKLLETKEFIHNIVMKDLL